MIITWQACPHILYTSDNEDQAGWQYLVAECPDCGAIGVNVEDGVVESISGWWRAMND